MFLSRYSTSERTLLTFTAMLLFLPGTVGRLGAASSLSPPNAGEPGILTVCEILSAPLRYNGRMVTVRGTTNATDEGWWLSGDECPGILVTDGFTWPAAISLRGPEDGPGLRLHAVDFTCDWNARHRLEVKYKRLRKHVAAGCMVYTLTGLFETREDWSKFRDVHPDGTVGQGYQGFGHLGFAPAQLLLKSEDNVEAIPDCGGKGRRRRR